MPVVGWVLLGGWVLCGGWYGELLAGCCVVGAAGWVLLIAGGWVLLVKVVGAELELRWVGAGGWVLVGGCTLLTGWLGRQGRLLG